MRLSLLAKILVFQGAIPFLLSTIAMIYFIDNNSYQAIIEKIAITYGSVIVSFLAGIHWGIALFSKTKISRYLLISSNCVALWAWGCLLLPYDLNRFVFIFLIAGFIIQWLIDYMLFKQMILKRWFIELRTNITIIVILCLILLSYVTFK